jgi:hypothetical protein
MTAQGEHVDWARAPCDPAQHIAITANAIAAYLKFFIASISISNPAEPVRLMRTAVSFCAGSCMGADLLAA